MRVAGFVRRHRFNVLVVVILASPGCPSRPEANACREFFAEPSTQRLVEFSSFNLSKQLTIHRCGLDHNPPTDYSSEIAGRGSIIIPDLLAELNRSDFSDRYDADLNKLSIILIFRRLATQGNLTNRSEITIILDRSVSEITTDWVRSEAENALEGIRLDAAVSAKP